MNIGKEKKETIQVDPIKDPVPRREPVRSPEPKRTPARREKEKVGASVALYPNDTGGRPTWQRT